MCRVGNDADNLGRDHWGEMLTYPRKPVAHWHPLVEVGVLWLNWHWPFKKHLPLHCVGLLCITLPKTTVYSKAIFHVEIFVMSLRLNNTDTVTLIHFFIIFIGIIWSDNQDWYWSDFGENFWMENGKKKNLNLIESCFASKIVHLH